MAIGRLKILLVEDNPGDVRLIQLALAEMVPPCDLLTAGRLRDAEPILREGNVDAVLLDLSLPDATGLETLQRIFSINDSVPVVVLTGQADDQLAQAAVLRGAQDYLVKGQAEPAQLLRALRYAVQRRRNEEVVRTALRAQVEREQAEAAARKFRWLAEASRTLANSLDVDTAAQALAQAAVQELAECASVLLAGDSGLRRAAMTVADPALEEAARELLKMPLPRGAGYLEAYTSGEPVLVDPLPEDASLGPRYLEVFHSLKLRRGVVIPLLARGKVLGVLALAHSEERSFSPEDVRLATDLGVRGAVALDNAFLYSRERAATHARDELIAVLSHDLRNPLSVIGMAAANLRRGASETVLTKLDKVERAVNAMTRLISDLMDVSRMDAGKLQLNTAPSDVAGLLDEALDAIRPLAAEKSLSLALDVDADIPPVLSEKERVLQVFSNLLGNAVKFTPAGGAVSVLARRAGSEVRFAVRDTGAGIGETQLPHIFDRFWQARTAARAGAGLGLAIAKGIVEAHGGRIWAESRPGAGATFHFTLPAA